jgi:hypothetical protein
MMSRQSPLQYGFTENTSPMIAAVVNTEIIDNVYQQNKQLYVAFLDSKKAFDVVWHNPLLRKLYLLGIEGNLWLLAHEITLSTSWFRECEDLCTEYILPSTHDLLKNPHTKARWKMLVDQAIYSKTTNASKNKSSNQKYDTISKYKQLRNRSPTPFMG